MAEHLLDEERVALGLRVDQIDQLGRRLASRTPFEQSRDAVPGETAQHDLLGQPSAQQGREHLGERPAGLELGVAVGADDEHGDLRQALRQMLDQEQGRLVGPVEILEDQDQRRVAGRRVRRTR